MLNQLNGAWWDFAQQSKCSWIFRKIFCERCLISPSNVWLDYFWTNPTHFYCQCNKFHNTFLLNLFRIIYCELSKNLTMIILDILTTLWLFFSQSSKVLKIFQFSNKLIITKAFKKTLDMTWLTFCNHFWIKHIFFSWFFMEAYFFGKCFFHHEIFCFELYWTCCWCNDFHHKMIGKFVQDQFKWIVSGHHYFDH